MIEPSEQMNNQQALYLLVLRCQESYRAWCDASEPQAQEALRAINGAAIEALWRALQPDLLRLAWRWQRSGIAPDLDSLAKSLFVHIISILPHKRFDPDRNIGSLLLLIAQRDMIDEYRKSYSNGPRSHQYYQAQVPPETNMWPAPPPSFAARTPSEECADLHNTETQIVVRLDQLQVLQTVWSHWSGELSDHDFQIVRLRWRNDPPLTFAEIARQLGSGWEEEAVRQRHHRILKNTREFLRTRGLID